MRLSRNVSGRPNLHAAHAVHALVIVLGIDIRGCGERMEIDASSAATLRGN